MKELVGLRRGGGSEVSDEHSTSLTVVLHDGKHQSQVIYSLPLARTLPLFSLVMYVCKHQTKKTQKKQETGRIAALIASLFLYPLPFVCLHPFKSAMQMHGWSLLSISQSHFTVSPLPFFYACSISLPASTPPSAVKCFVIVKRQP